MSPVASMNTKLNTIFLQVDKTYIHSASKYLPKVYSFEVVHTMVGLFALETRIFQDRSCLDLSSSCFISFFNLKNLYIIDSVSKTTSVTPVTRKVMRAMMEQLPD